MAHRKNSSLFSFSASLKVQVTAIFLLLVIGGVMSASLNREGHVLCGRQLTLALMLMCAGEDFDHSIEMSDIGKVTKQISQLCCTQPCTTETLLSYCPTRE